MRITLELNEEQAHGLLLQLQKVSPSQEKNTREPTLLERATFGAAPVPGTTDRPEAARSLLLEGPDCVPLPDEPKAVPTSTKKQAEKKQETFAEQAEKQNADAVITSKQWSNLLNAGFVTGKNFDAIDAIVKEKFNCRVRDLKQSQYEAAVEAVRG